MVYFEATISPDTWWQSTLAAGFIISTVVIGFILSLLTRGRLALLMPQLKLFFADKGFSLRMQIFLVYASQSFIYICLFVMFGSLVYMANNLGGLTGASIFFAGLLVWLGSTLFFCMRSCNWLFLNAFHIFCGYAMLISFIAFIGIQLYSNKDYSDGSSYRAAGTLWITLSLTPLYFFVGEKGEGSKNVALPTKVDYVTIPPVKLQTWNMILSETFQDCYNTESVPTDDDTQKARSETKQNNESDIEKKNSDSFFGWVRKRSKKIRKAFKRIFSLSLDFHTDTWLWFISLIPFAFFGLITVSREGVSSRDAALLVFIVSVLNEFLCASLQLSTPVIFSLVIINRYVIVLCGAYYWLLGSGLVLIISSTMQLKQIIESHFPDPKGKSTALYSAMHTMTRKKEEMRRMTITSTSQAQKSVVAVDMIDLKDLENISIADLDEFQDGEINAGGKEEEEVNHNNQQNNGIVGQEEIEEVKEVLSKVMQEEESRKQFSIQLSSLFGLQIVLSVCCILGVYQPSLLQLYPIYHSPQVEWVALLWFTWVFIVLALLCRHTIRSGGFGSSAFKKLTSPLKNVNRTMDLREKDQEQQDKRSDAQRIDDNFFGVDSTFDSFPAIIDEPVVSKEGDDIVNSKSKGKKQKRKHHTANNSCLQKNGIVDRFRRKTRKFIKRFFASFSDMVFPELEEKEYVGVLVFMTWLVLIGVSCVTARLSNYWILVPLACLLPISVYHFLNFLRNWESEGCHLVSLKQISNYISATFSSCIDGSWVKVEGPEIENDRIKEKRDASAFASKPKDMAVEFVDRDHTIQSTEGKKSNVQAAGGQKISDNTVNEDAWKSPDTNDWEYEHSGNEQGNEVTNSVSTENKSDRPNDNVKDNKIPGNSPSLDNGCWNSTKIVFGHCLSTNGTILYALYEKSGRLYNWCNQINTLQHASLTFILSILLCMAFDMNNSWIGFALGLWLLAFGITLMAIARWRCTIEFDIKLGSLIVSSWIPTIIFCIVMGYGKTIEGVTANAGYVIVLILMAATSVQIFIFSVIFWRDLRQMYPKHKMILSDVKKKSIEIVDAPEESGDDLEDGTDNSNEDQYHIIKSTEVFHDITCNCCNIEVQILSFEAATGGSEFPTSVIFWCLTTSFILAFACIVVFLINVSSGVGVGCLFLHISFASYIYNKLDLLKFTSKMSSKSKEFISNITTAILPLLIIVCGFAGATMNPDDSFWYASFGWLSLAALCLYMGLWEDFRGNRKSYHSNFYPVYEANYTSYRSEVLTDVSIKASFVIMFFVMIVLWSMWCSVVVEPSDFGVIIYVMAFATMALYLKFISEGIFISSITSEISPQMLIKALDESFDVVYHTVASTNTIEQSSTSTDDVHIGEVMDKHSKTENELLHKQMMTNMKKIDKLVGERDKCMMELHDLISKICQKSLSSWLMANYIWGYCAGQLENEDSWDSLNEKSTEVLEKHNECVLHASQLNELSAIARLKAIEKAATAKKLQECELISFLRDTQENNQLTEEDMIYLPYALVVQVKDAFKEYTEVKDALEREAIKKADAEERLSRAREVVRLRQQEKQRKDFEVQLRLRNQAEEAARRKQAEEEQKKHDEDETKKHEEEKRNQRDREKKSLKMGVITTFGAEISDDADLTLKLLLESDDLLFSDPDFKNTSFIMGPGSELDNKKYTINRISEVDPDLEKKVDRKLMPINVGPRPSDVQQGSLGDCYLLSAIGTYIDNACVPITSHTHTNNTPVHLYSSAPTHTLIYIYIATIAEKPELIRDMIKYADMKKGIFVVRICVNAQFKLVLLDDFFPVYKSSKNTLCFQKYTRSNDVAKHGNSLWVAVLEKAYAKVHGNYQNIVGGFEDQAMADLTGGIPDRMTDLKKNMEETWTMIMNLQQGGHLLGAGSQSGKDTDTNDQGIVKGHAYSILEVKQVDKHRLLQMRNPWGHKEWSGRWADNSPEWTPRYKKLLNYVNADDGTFWISIEDFVRNFRAIYYCKLVNNCKQLILQGEWNKTNKTAGGCQYQECLDNPQYLLKVASKCKVIVVLTQNENIKSGDVYDDNRYSSVKAIGLHAKKYPSGQTSGKLTSARATMVAQRTFSYARDMTLEFTVDERDNVIIVPCMFKKNDENTFTMKVYADTSELKCTQIYPEI